MPELTQPLNGLNGKVTVDVSAVETTIAGLSAWTVGENTREVVDVPDTFGVERSTNIIQQKEVTNFSFEGYLLPGDEAQDTIRDAYDNKTKLTSIKFYLDATNYLAPISGDHVLITEIGEITQGPDQFATFSASGIFVHEYEEGTV